MRAFEYETLILEEILTELQRTKQELLDMVSRLELMIIQLDQEGERDNARRLLARVLTQLKDEYGWEPPKQKKQGTGDSQTHQKTDDLSFKVVFFGRLVDPTAGKRGSDKVWGWGVKGDYIYHFWGPTGGTPQVKKMNNTQFNLNASDRKARVKAAKGYQKMSAAQSADWINQVLKRHPKFS